MMVGIRRHLMSWGTGTAHRAAVGQAGAAVVVLQSTEQMDVVRNSDLVGEDSIVFVPGQPPDAAGPMFVGYDGTVDESCGELSLDGSFYLQTQTYGLSRYLSVVGPTLIRIVDDADFESYLADADLAKDTGTFPTFLIEPLVRVADLPGIGAGAGDDGPRARLYVTADGEVSTSPSGQSIGLVDHGLAALEMAWTAHNERSSQPCSVCLAAAVPEGVRAAALSERPWLGRYLTALQALRTLRLRGVPEVRVSGFGARLSQDARTETADHGDGLQPLLLWNDERAFLYEPATGRTFSMDRRTAEQLERWLVHGSDSVGGDAASHIAGLLASHGIAPEGATAGSSPRKAGVR